MKTGEFEKNWQVDYQVSSHFATEVLLELTVSLNHILLGFPAIIVAISLGATQTDGYGSSAACWLDVKNGLIWAFVAPAVVIILVSKNFFILLFSSVK